MGGIFSSSKVTPNKGNNTVNKTTNNNTNKKLIIEGFNILQDICIINYDEQGKIFENGFKPIKSTNTKNYIPDDIKNKNLELYSIIIVCTLEFYIGKKSSKKIIFNINLKNILRIIILNCFLKLMVH